MTKQRSEWQNIYTWEVAAAFKQDRDAWDAAHVFIFLYRQNFIDFYELIRLFKEYTVYRSYFLKISTSNYLDINWNQVVKKWADHAIVAGAVEEMTPATKLQISLILKNSQFTEFLFKRTQNNTTIWDLVYEINELVAKKQLPSIYKWKRKDINWYAVVVYFTGTKTIK